MRSERADGEEADVRANQRNQPITGINVLRWELGNELRDLRLAAGKSIAEAARWLECSNAKISRMENGQRGAVARDVRDLCKLYGVPAQRRDQLMALSREAAATDRAAGSTIPGKFGTYVALETKAVNLRAYESTFIPGLLQTQRYARAVITKNGDLTEEAEIADRVRIRLERQRRLVETRELRAHFIIDENVLWRPIGRGAQAAAAREEQLDHLIRVSRLPNVILQVVPYEVGFYWGMEASGINLLDLEDGSTTCYLEGIFTELFVRGHSEISTIAAKFELVLNTALSPGDTRKFLMRIARGNYAHWSSSA
ncbi:helix-turn-helix transcriptional regulator [Catenulispora subtropica]|uniref:Helix-turn-helix transcriptional regulator n=1 Tax=Catenulispora subtropica TaxID=450798 RepID=A0ABN2QER4_9ACTN